MSKTYLRLYRKLKVLNDGSSVYKYDNGCKNSSYLFKKDISISLPWSKNQDNDVSKKDLSLLEKYKKNIKRTLKTKHKNL